MLEATNAAVPATDAGAAKLVTGERVQQYLTFVLSGETFAIGILAIKEIIE